MKSVVLSHRLDETRRQREFFSLVEVIFGNVENEKIRNEDIKATAHVSCFGKSQRACIRISGTIQRRDSEYIGRRMLRMELT